jgi:hypothetical protein
MIAKRIYLLTILFAGCLLMAACSDDPEPAAEEPPGEEPLPEDPDGGSAEGNFFKLIRVENLKGDIDADDESDKTIPMYYSLEENIPRAKNYAKTTRWDMSFSNIKNSAIAGNNGKDSRNFGSGNNATGGIYILEKTFDEVVDVPKDAVFKTDGFGYGTDDRGAFGTGIGWYLYDFTGTLGPPHVAYAQRDRTLIVRTAKGNYAKVRMISIYKDAPEAPDTHTPSPYFTFEYVLVPKESTRFEIKE